MAAHEPQTGPPVRALLSGGGRCRRRTLDHTDFPLEPEQQRVQVRKRPDGKIVPVARGGGNRTQERSLRSAAAPGRPLYHPNTRLHSRHVSFFLSEYCHPDFPDRTIAPAGSVASAFLRGDSAVQPVLASCVAKDSLGHDRILFAIF